MDTSLANDTDENDCVRRMEAKDEHLRHLRLKVEIHASQLTKASGSEREQVYLLYKQAMHRLLSYLETSIIE